MRKVIFLFLLIFLFIASGNRAFATFSFNISSTSTTKISSGDQEVDVGLSITDLPSESYFRVSLQKSNGDPYFGYVQNNDGTWSKAQSLSGDCTGYYHVTDLSTSSLTLKFKVGNDSVIDGGNYTLRAHRFTKSCSSNTEAANSIDFALNFPTPTPTPSPTPTPTRVPTPTPTPKIPTPTKSPSPTPVKSSSQSSSPSPIKTLTPTPKISLTSSRANNSDKIATDFAKVQNVSPDPSQKPESAVLGASKNNLPFIVISVLGIILFLGAAVLGVYRYWEPLVAWILKE